MNSCDILSAAKDKRRDVVRIVLPVTASVLALAAAGMYFVWRCRLRGRMSEYKIFFYYRKILMNFFQLNVETKKTERK
jgi:hypothetical protein